ncbi:MAG: polysaccharide deacetylase family protein [Deltaproteobacteria bacterium]|nr:polysaccharide deacetylase family protein [Deltaproteobacteria bacterium]
MKQHVKILVALVFVFFGIIFQAHAYITVLLYHKFDEANSPSTTISSGMFDEQMAYLKRGGYHILSMNELEQCIQGKAPIPDKGVVITIDDGYLSVYTKAFPILKKYGFPFTVFVFSRSIGAPNYMSWEQLKDLQDHGGALGAHSYSHPHMVDIPASQIEKEFILPKEIFERELNAEMRWFAYPFGEYDNQIRTIGKRSGFTLLLTSDPGSVGSETEPDLIPRQAIVGQNMNMVRFIEKLQRPPLAVLQRTPPRGRLQSKALDRIEVTIKDPQQYLPGQIQMFLSEKGRLETKFNSLTGTLICEQPIVLTRQVNRISVTARRKADNLFARDSYMIVLPEE